MNAADKIAATTRRLRETRAEIERASAAPRLVTRVAATTATERLRDQHRAALASSRLRPLDRLDRRRALAVKIRGIGPRTNEKRNSTDSHAGQIKLPAACRQR